MNFTQKSVMSAQAAYNSLKEYLASIRRISSDGVRQSLSSDKLGKIEGLKKKFLDAVNNDLNTAEALAVVWETIKSNIPPSDKYDLTLLFDEVLGLSLDQVAAARDIDVDMPDSVKKLIKKREEARKRKDFEASDKHRQEIKKKGYVVEDTANGSVIKKI
jgi:cysteinyl-tRNA synthetase